MAGYIRTGNEYLREVAKMKEGIGRIFHPEPTNPDDYIIAKDASDKLLAVINEKKTEEEALTRAVLRQKEKVRNLKAEIEALTSDIKNDLGRGCEEGCYDADMKARHDSLLSWIKRQRSVMSSCENRLLRLETKQLVLEAQMKRDRERSTVLQQRSKGTWSSINKKIDLARGINALIETAQRPASSINRSRGCV